MFAVQNRQREVVCWAIAGGLHCLLLFWTAAPFNLFEGDPIISVDFIIEEIQPLGQVVAREPSAGRGGIFKRIKKLLGFSEKAIQQTKPSKQLLTGDLSQKIKSKAPLKDFTKEQKLVDKKRTKGARGFEVGPVAGASSDRLQGLASSTIPGEGTDKKDFKDSTKKLADKQYRVARSDLPFEIARAPKGELATGRVNGDTPAIAVGKKTDRGVFNVSKRMAQDKGTFGGSGSGEGSLSGIGGFSNVAPTTRTEREAAGSGLSGAEPEDYGTTGSIGRGSRKFSGIGSTSGGIAGGELGEGTQLAAGGGGGSGKGKSGGSDRVLFELSGPLSNRRIIHQVIPLYPEWAKKKGIIARVSLYFFVLHTGQVKNNIVIQRTSGYPKLDKTAMEALIKWKFAALPKSQYGKEQWGVITFKFKIR